MFGVFLLAALQGPWSATAPHPRPAAAAPTRGRGVIANARPAARPRLNIDLSGLSDDDAVAVPGFNAAVRPAPASSTARTLVWSPRLGTVSPQNALPARPPLATLTLARDFGEDAPDSRIDPTVADLIGSVQLPMIGSTRTPRPLLAAPVTTRTLARAPTSGPRRYEPGRW